MATISVVQSLLVLRISFPQLLAPQLANWTQVEWVLVTRRRAERTRNRRSIPSGRKRLFFYDKPSSSTAGPTKTDIQRDPDVSSA